MELSQKGTLYGVGVGPGDPELLTLKAVRLIRHADVIAAASRVPEEALSYRIAIQAVPSLAEKEKIGIDLPMTRDPLALRRAWEKGADILASILDTGRSAVFLTLGDSSIYSTFSYLAGILKGRGYPAEYISGIPSFCAAAAACGLPLSEWDESIHIIPALHGEADAEIPEGTRVYMKAGKDLGKLRDRLLERGMSLAAAENCGLENEKVYRDEEIPDQAGYFTILIAKEGKES